MPVGMLQSTLSLCRLLQNRRCLTTRRLFFGGVNERVSKGSALVKISSTLYQGVGRRMIAEIEDIIGSSPQPLSVLASI